MGCADGKGQAAPVNLSPLQPSAPRAQRGRVHGMGDAMWVGRTLLCCLHTASALGIAAGGVELPGHFHSGIAFSSCHFLSRQNPRLLPSALETP